MLQKDLAKEEHTCTADSISRAQKGISKDIMAAQPTAVHAADATNVLKDQLGR